MPEASTVAIIGVGNAGSALARDLSQGSESIVLAAKERAHGEAVAETLGPLVRAASVEDAIADADVIIFALWLDDMKEVIPQQARLLEGKVVIDPSNPVSYATSSPVRTLPEGQSAASIEASLRRQLGADDPPPWCATNRHFGNERGTAIAIVSIRHNLAVMGYRTGIQSRYLSWRSVMDSPAQRDQLPSTCNAHIDT
jgi:hypothetical protein